VRGVAERGSQTEEKTIGSDHGQPMKITRVEKITNEKWLNLYMATYEHNGHTGRWVFASRRNECAGQAGKCDAVIIVPILHEEGHPPRLVMIREFRIPVGGYDYGFPAGLIEEGESIEETVRREILEETGMDVIRFRKISPPVFSSAGMTDEATVVAFIDVRTAPETKQTLEHSEDIEVVLLDHEQVCKMCDEPNLPLDAKAWHVLYMYQQLGQLA
jgi:ADP-ribose diphosphatase